MNGSSCGSKQAVARRCVAKRRCRVLPTADSTAFEMFSGDGICEKRIVFFGANLDKRWLNMWQPSVVLLAPPCVHPGLSLPCLETMTGVGSQATRNYTASLCNDCGLCFVHTCRGTWWKWRCTKWVTQFTQQRWECPVSLTLLAYLLYTVPGCHVAWR